jgi:hypothetical protein
MYLMTMGNAMIGQGLPYEMKFDHACSGKNEQVIKQCWLNSLKEPVFHGYFGRQCR